MLLRSIISLCFGLLLSGCGTIGAAGIGFFAGPVTCAEKVSEDKDAGVLDYLKVPAAPIFGPFVAISREWETSRWSGYDEDPQGRIKYIANVCDPRSREEYSRDLREQKKKQQEEK